MKKIDLSSFENKRTALVLSGGVAKAAAWHLGVALALDEMGFNFKTSNEISSPLCIDTLVGSSAGAMVSTYLASEFSPQDVINATLGIKGAKLRSVTYRDMLSLKKAIKSPRRGGNYDPFEGFPYFLRKLLSPVLNFSGLFTTAGLHDYLLENVLKTNSFDDYVIDLFIIATQLDHSRKVIFGKYNYPNPSHDNTATYYTGINIAEAAAASMSVPPFYSPYPVKNTLTNQIDYYIDGEIRETLSTHVAADNGCEYIISSWTHTPYHFHDEIGSLINYGLPAICTQAIFLMIQKKIIASRAKHSSAKDIYNTVHDYMEKENFSNRNRRNILNILERKLGYKEHIKYIDIYPEHSNYEVFLSNSFSLSPVKTAKVLKAGYRRTMDVFRNLR